MNTFDKGTIYEGGYNTDILMVLGVCRTNVKVFHMNYGEVRFIPIEDLMRYYKQVPIAIPGRAKQRGDEEC